MRNAQFRLCHLSTPTYWISDGLQSHVNWRQLKSQAQLSGMTHIMYHSRIKSIVSKLFLTTLLSIQYSVLCSHINPVTLICPWARKGHNATSKRLSGSSIILFMGPLIKNQDVNTRYLGTQSRIWMVFKMATKVKYKCLYYVISVSNHLLYLLLQAYQLYLRS